MRNKLVASVLAVVVMGPSLALLAVAVLSRPATQRACTTLPTPSQAGQVVLPVPDGSYRVTSGFGLRDDPLGGGRRLHAGMDFAAPDGTPILAVADGTVTHSGPSAGGGNRIIIGHHIDGQELSSVYRHMWDDGIHVTVGQTVGAGQHIADVGSQGRSTGPHLHLEIRPGGWPKPAVDPQDWLTRHDAATTDGPSPGGQACGPGTAPPPLPFIGINGVRLADPTGTGGFVTSQLAHLITQTQQAFPDSGWACWSPRPGSRSEHPLGRACDITVGNQIGTMPDADQLAYGWQMATWLQVHAEALQVTYVIWQGLIWSHTRTTEGWRPYNGGGMHDPSDVTGGHYDHLHVTVDA